MAPTNGLLIPGDADAALSTTKAVTEAPSTVVERPSDGCDDDGVDTDNAYSESDADGETQSDRRKRRHAALCGRHVQRKPTYLARKAGFEEKEALAHEIRVLEERLEALRVRAGLPTRAAQRTLAALQHANVETEEAIHSHLIGLAQFQSRVAQHLHSLAVDPMATFIHLSRDHAERRAMLRAIRPMKLRRAKELVMDRLHGFSETQPYVSEERFVSHDGNYHCRRFDIHQFRGLRCGVRELYEALILYLSNRDISITEMLGQLTIREDMDVVDPTLWHHRIVSTTGAGYVQDLNTVGFAEFVDQTANLVSESDDESMRGPYGIIATDAVDVDDLYPYVPHERVRKDVTAALLVCEAPGARADDPPVAVLKRCVFVTIHKPQFPLPPSVLDEVIANVGAWSTVMARFLRDHDDRKYSPSSS